MNISILILILIHSLWFIDVTFAQLGVDGSGIKSQMMSVLGLQDNLERLILDGLNLVKLNVIALISQHISRFLI